MNQFELASEIYGIVGKYEKQHVKSFYASSILDDLQEKGINYVGMSRDIVIFLNSLVKNGLLKKKYIIFNPENQSEKKVFDNLSQVPIDDYINFDFHDIYIDSLSSPLIETFFVFSKDNISLPKDVAPHSLKVRKVGAFKSEIPEKNDNRNINKYYIQNMYIIESKKEIMGDNINQNFNNNTIGQASGKISNKDTTINASDKIIKDIDWKEIYNLISKIGDLKTGNSQVDTAIKDLNNSIKSAHNDNEFEQKAKVTTHINNLYTMCKTAKIGLPLLSKLFQLFGFTG
ncbi:hypothetical protein [Lactobacillus paragasseri]|uniref:Uncharacterized protein n=1 Tax=Lactobacillus paragasseri TaxID=2107999 RepID=A0ABD5A110_9LACO|nr:hypothetical protein [Lactobacillus paragasseri]MDK7951770.1 hypothetical protein [Lactobacillus paragasseri]MDO6361335.1 hypothetical protein [Lactobacillus paragasseri]MDX5059559.1 hypothetical protein [Lactobacillus paragasseri]